MMLTASYNIVNKLAQLASQKDDMHYHAFHSDFLIIQRNLVGYHQASIFFRFILPLWPF